MTYKGDRNESFCTRRLSAQAYSAAQTPVRVHRRAARRRDQPGGCLGISDLCEDEMSGMIKSIIDLEVSIRRTLQLINTSLVLGFIALGVLPGFYVILRLFFLSAAWFIDGDTEQALLDSVMSGLAATVFGVLIGIPVALWLGRKQQQAIEAKEKKEEAKERRERERLILAALWEELGQNQVILEEVIASHDNFLYKKATFELQDVLWKAFSDGGELKWINDLQIFRHLSLAYGQIATLIHLERQYTDISELPNIMPGAREERNATRARRIRAVAVAATQTALRLLDEKIKER